MNEGRAASACVGGELGGGSREASSLANVEAPQAPAASVGECAGGATPPPHPHPPGSVQGASRQSGAGAWGGGRVQ